jgi:uncharacterized protein (DUF305 family)
MPNSTFRRRCARARPIVDAAAVHVRAVTVRACATTRNVLVRAGVPAAVLVFTTACAGQTPEPQPAPGPQVVQPGAPGEENRVLSASEVAQTELPGHTDADTRFMQGMLVHHAQALVMTDMVVSRTNNRDIRLLARRIELSQDDEIKLMRRWLEERGESITLGGTMGEHTGHGDMDHGDMDHGGMDHRAGGEHGEVMHGMLSSEDLARLAAASGPDFDRLFLEFMIRHHEGAVRMVQDLFASPGAGQEEEIFQFASHVEADQNIEVLRMRGMLRTGR